jgi:hypothetical protein
VEECAGAASAEGLNVKVKVEGLAAKIDAVFRFDKELWRAMQKDIKTAVDVVATDARSRVPAQGLYSSRSGYSGWGKWIATKGNRVLSFEQSIVRGSIKSRARSRSRAGFREVKGVVEVMNPAGAIFMLAGSQNRSGHPFNTSINRQHGGSVGARGNQFWPRILTPARYAKGGEAAQKIAAIVERGVNDINSA